MRAQTGHQERRNVDSIFVLDVSQSMVEDVQKLLITKGLARTNGDAMVVGNVNKVVDFLRGSRQPSAFYE